MRPILAILALCFLAPACSPAQAAPTGAMLEVAAGVPGQTSLQFSGLASWVQLVGTTVTRIGDVGAEVNDGGPFDGGTLALDGGGSFSVSYFEVRCQNLSNTPVYFGDTNISDDRRRYPVCADADACKDSVITMPVRNARAIVASSPTSVSCIAVR